MDLELWREITLSIGTALGVLGFFRSLEQRKDEAFGALTVRLCSRESPVMRAGAAGQLPSFFRYRRYLILHRPYRRQALELAVNALKIAGEPVFVRQALVDALMKMLPSHPGERLLPRLLGSRCPAWWKTRLLSRYRRDREIRLIGAYLDRLIMMGFVFDYADLTEATLTESGLEGASFVGVNLWKASLHNSNLMGTDFTAARLWETDLTKTNITGARLVGCAVNDGTKWPPRIDGALLSAEVAEMCRRRGCDVGGSQIQ